MDTIKLLTGETLTIEEQDIPGMAGEPMTIVFLYIGTRNVTYKEIQYLLPEDERQSLVDYLNSIKLGNEVSAIRYCR